MPTTGIFGIDFGTTNTRVAYLSPAGKLRMVRLAPATSQPFQLPSLISCKAGAVVAIGAKARTDGVLLGKPIKWLLGGTEDVEVDGGKRDPVSLAADFFRELAQLVQGQLKSEKLTRAALTIPVHYPPLARRQLQEACKQAGIEVTHFFFEPTAAIYANLAASPVTGMTAVFDWGGGSLDIATVEIRGGVAYTRQIDGWHRGGSDFDLLLCEQAVNGFLLNHPLPGVTTAHVLHRLKEGRALRLRAEEAKIQLAAQPQQPVTLQYSGFLGGQNLAFPVTGADFTTLVDPDVTSGLARLQQALTASRSSPKTLASLYLSGGTCNLPQVRDRVMQLVGHRVVNRLTLRKDFVPPDAGNELRDIGNATALGAALLAAQDAPPVFANALGLRLANAAGDTFYPVFQAGERADFQPRPHRLFLSDASTGVARVLVCDQEPNGLPGASRLLRICTIPVDRTENWIDLTFTLDRHLVLKVEGKGPKQPHFEEPAWIQHLNLGFQLPPGGKGAGDGSLFPQ